MTTTAWSGRAVQQARSVVLGWLPQPCGQCGQPVHPTERWVVGHKIARWLRPDLTFDPANWQAEHRACSDRTGQANALAKARAEGARAQELGAFSPDLTAGQSPPLPRHTYGGQQEPLEVREDLLWANHAQNAPAWLEPYLEVPQDASAPLAMTPVHPDAVGSYGPECIAWAEDNLPDVRALRWWQRLALVRQLEHDAEGRLIWRTVLESGPRRVGKSVKLRAAALWRIDVGAQHFGEPQLAMHCGKDLSIAREIHRKAWAWAGAHPGWDVRRGVGQEEVNHVDEHGEHRWLVRSLDAVFGFDVGSAAVDEGWAVPPTIVDDALEPAMLERQSPQLLLTSTAHRKATSLMRQRLSAALATDDGETLLLLWGARPQDDPGDPAVWRAASPYWSEDRARTVAAKYAKALAGEADPQADDPDPMEGFRSQYLNVWLMRAPRAAQRGQEVISEADWAALAAEPPFDLPDAAAIESWFSEGVSLALAWRTGTGVVVSASDHPDLATAVAALKESGFKGTATVGSSLMKDPALNGIRKKAGEGRTVSAVSDLQRLLTEDALHHDGSEHLTGQVLGLRTLPGADGPRMASTGRADAVKAALWAAQSARAKAGKPRLLLPSA